MAIDHFAINAVDRSAEQQGKGASRRLRKQNLVPAIIYGGGEEPTTISIKINELVKSLEFEAFFSQILTIRPIKAMSIKSLSKTCSAILLKVSQCMLTSSAL